MQLPTYYYIHSVIGGVGFEMLNVPPLPTAPRAIAGENMRGAIFGLAFFVVIFAFVIGCIVAGLLG